MTDRQQDELAEHIRKKGGFNPVACEICSELSREEDEMPDKPPLIGDEEIRDGVFKLIREADYSNLPEILWEYTLADKILSYLKSRGYMSREEINAWLVEKGAHRVRGEEGAATVCYGTAWLEPLMMGEK